jgi:hypothetical protein
LGAATRTALSDRIWLRVEFGLVTGEWFSIPVDPGTARVLRDGCRIVADREDLAREALQALSLARITWSRTAMDRPRGE